MFYLRINKRTREKGLCVLDLSQLMFQLKNAINTREKGRFQK